jgi:hypothetical protein
MINGVALIFPSGYGGMGQLLNVVPKMRLWMSLERYQWNSAAMTMEGSRTRWEIWREVPSARLTREQREETVVLIDDRREAD